MLTVMKGYNFIGVAVIDEVNEKLISLYVMMVLGTFGDHSL